MSGYNLIRLRRPVRELVEGAEAVLPFAKRLRPGLLRGPAHGVGAMTLEAAEPLRARQWFADGLEVVRANYADMDPEEADSLLAKGLNSSAVSSSRSATTRPQCATMTRLWPLPGGPVTEEEEGQIRGNIAVLKSEAGDDESAVVDYQQAITVAKKYGDIAHVEVWTGNLANALSDLKRYAEAEAAAREALSLARQLGDRRQRGRRLGILADVTRELGNAKLALEYQLSGYQIAVEFGDSFSQGRP